MVSWSNACVKRVGVANPFYSHAVRCLRITINIYNYDEKKLIITVGLYYAYTFYL